MWWFFFILKFKYLWSITKILKKFVGQEIKCDDNIFELSSVVYRAQSKLRSKEMFTIAKQIELNTSANK